MNESLEKVRQANRAVRALLLIDVDEEKVCWALSYLEEIESELGTAPLPLTSKEAP